ncbi:MAG: tRNA lysidine(34) synthetase TilS [Anaerolineaceae bacterium]|nr:tRNA lysidine(34) synthetase TilS [Anaerolineaceae bacterium]
MDFDIKKWIKKTDLDLKKPFIVGVSGGADSMFLLDLMVKSNLNCIAAHFNHQIRSDALNDAHLVEQKAADYGIPFFLGDKNVKLVSQQEHLSLEEAARKCRYRFLFNLAEIKMAQAVVVAHHANDQVETVLMHFLRGTGLEGLRGMQPITLIPEFHTSIPIFRPLLSIWREEIEDYCEAHQINYAIDPTNVDTTYTRNKIRHDLIPQLENNYPGFKDRLVAMSEILRADSEIIQNTENQALTNVCIKEGKGFLQFSKHEFLQEPIGIQRRLIRRAIIQNQPTWRDISFDTVEKAIENIKKHTSGEFDLVNFNSLILHNRDFFIVNNKTDWIETIFPQLGLSSPVLIEGPGVYHFQSKWQIIVSLYSVRKFQVGTDNQNKAYFDAEKAGEFPWKLNNWHPGDRFRPFGMRSGKMKLSDLFINEKIIKPARKSWPVLFNQNNDLLWVVGIRADDRFRIQEFTKNIIEVKLERTN